ncbi:MAG: hypothetical protein HGB03_02870 [Candidatus Yonathbacteria bacterium]|nr:hypothetical protein [Candidatus Yonathbacteria bacterium]NTW47423.1 hypothetical protein [Candidatus Yonathbacteria bacterium]
MEEFPLNKKESGINRVVGFDHEKETDFLDYFKEKFERNFLEYGEREKTLEEIAILNRVNKDMVEFLRHYGVEAIEISPNNIHILDKSRFTSEELKKIQERFGTESGFYSSNKQGVGIMKDYEENKLSFLQTVVHEELHLQGFYSYQKSLHEGAEITLKKEDDLVDMNTRRSGFSMGTTDGKTLFFRDVNEAIITELQIRFERMFLEKYPELESELEARDDYIQEVARRDDAPIEKVREVVGKVIINEDGERKWRSYAYHEERKKFAELIDELYKKNMSDFESREDVFNLFAQATLTGRVLPVARLIEKTFGKGAFRKLGEGSAENYVE